MTVRSFDTLLEMCNSKTILTDFPNMEEPLGLTLEKQLETETSIQSIYDDIMDSGSQSYPAFRRRDHINYVHSFLMKPLPQGYSKMITNIPWMTYWLSNAAISLQSGLLQTEIDGINKRVLACFQYDNNDNSIGGFAGGEGQLPHLASSYAAILSLANAFDTKTLQLIDRSAIKRWLLKMKQSDGSFIMHFGGESDCRSMYCALVVAKLLDILDDQLLEGCNEWLLSCQTYEGGFSGEPNGEAHGGYTYCALASLVIINGVQNISRSDFDLKSLISWCTQRQFSLEGGMSGRTNKLVDACYSHWVGNSLGLLELIINAHLNRKVDNYLELWDRRKMMAYLICCCQGEDGGLRDKPDAYVDFYHTCYALCGLSCCQFIHLYENNDDFGFEFSSLKIEDEVVVDQNPLNFVNCIEPIFALPSGVAKRFRDHFAQIDN